MGVKENAEIMARLRDLLLEVYRTESPKSEEHAIVEKGLQIGALHLRFSIDLGANPYVLASAVGNKDGREQRLFRFGGSTALEN